MEQKAQEVKKTIEPVKRPEEKLDPKKLKVENRAKSAKPVSKPEVKPEALKSEPISATTKLSQLKSKIMLNKKHSPLQGALNKLAK